MSARDESRRRGEVITPAQVGAIVLDELVYARLRFGPIASPHEGLAVVLEEYRELEHDVFGNRGRDVAALAEAVQLAAMAMRYVLDVGGDAALDLLEHVHAFGTVRGAGET